MEQAAYPSLEKGIGGIMKRLFILLTVCTLILAGCSGQKEQPITESQSVETLQVEETVSTEIEETEVVEIAEVESTEESVPTDAEESKEEPEPTTKPEKPQQDAEQSKPEDTTPVQEEKPEPKQPASTEAPIQAPSEPEQPKEQPTEAPAEVEAVAYDPYEVVSLATAKTKAYGEITKEEYDEYYPYDGAGYYSVFVETDLNQVATTSGRKLGSVDVIASYIAEMLSLETGLYFYIEYAGVHSINGTDFYEFRCYRA